MRHTQ